MTEPGIVAPGPLVVSTANPRYFAVRSTDGAEEQLVYLTGSHINNNFHDGLGFGPECPAEPERFDFDGYLDFLEAHGHNFIRPTSTATSLPGGARPQLHRQLHPKGACTASIWRANGTCSLS
jgi:hypothetical protein